jgi:trimeric autotransporter adhesin
MAKRMHAMPGLGRAGGRLMLAASAALVVAGTLSVGTAQAASTSGTILTVAGNGTAGYSGDGHEPRKAELNVPTGVAEDQSHDIFIGDTQNNRVRKFTQPQLNNLSTDVISTIAGNGTAGFGGDGGPATGAELNHPSGVAVDPGGNVYIADTGNNRIREVSTSGIITTVAGSGTCSSARSDGPATKASLCLPTGIALDAADKNLFISDTGHNVVRELNLSGKTISTFAGTGQIGSSGDGGAATNAKLAGPTGIATDTSSDVYIADTGNCRVRVVKANLTINAFAGTGSCGFSGDGGGAAVAKLSLPTGVGLDPLGDVFISDTGNSRIREVTGALNGAGGTISTFAGTGTPGFSGDGGPANLAKLFIPTGNVAADGAAVYFADTGNQRVRAVYSGPPPVLPQTSMAILLPISAALVVLAGGSVVWLRRRRHPASAVAG